MRFVDKKAITKFYKVNRYIDRAMRRFIDEEKSDLLKTANEINANADLFPANVQNNMKELIKNIESDNFDKAVDNCVVIERSYGADFEKACAKAAELALSIEELAKLVKEEEKNRKTAEKYQKVVERQNKEMKKQRAQKLKEATKEVKVAAKQIKAYEKEAAMDDKKASAEAKKIEKLEKKLATLQKKLAKEKDATKKTELEKQVKDLKSEVEESKRVTKHWNEMAKAHHKSLLEYKQILEKAQKDVEQYSVDIFAHDSTIKLIRDCRRIIDNRLKKYRMVRKLDSIIRVAEIQEAKSRRKQLLKRLNSMIG